MGTKNCMLIALSVMILLLIAACGDNAVVSEPDSAPPSASVDAAIVPSPDSMVAPDAEVLAPCSDVCPGEQLIAWPETGTATYNICLPSYKHCCLTETCQ